MRQVGGVTTCVICASNSASSLTSPCRFLTFINKSSLSALVYTGSSFLKPENTTTTFNGNIDYQQKKNYSWLRFTFPFCFQRRNNILDLLALGPLGLGGDSTAICFLVVIVSLNILVSLFARDRIEKLLEKWRFFERRH